MTQLGTQKPAGQTHNPIFKPHRVRARAISATAPRGGRAPPLHAVAGRGLRHRDVLVGRVQNPTPGTEFFPPMVSLGKRPSVAVAPIEKARPVTNDLVKTGAKEPGSVEG